MPKPKAPTPPPPIEIHERLDLLKPVRILRQWISRWNESPNQKAARTGKPVRMYGSTTNPPPTGKRPPPPPPPPMSAGHVFLLEADERYEPAQLVMYFKRIDNQLGMYYNAAERAEWWYKNHPQLGEPAIETLLKGDWRSVEKTLAGLEGQVAT